MASSLQQSTQTTKRLGLSCIVIILVITAVQFTIGVLSNNDTIGGLPAEVPTNGFGDLPELAIENLSLSEESNPTYSIETPTGRLPILPEIVNVYKLESPRESLISLDKAVEVAEKYDFEGNYEVLDDEANMLRWSRGGRKQVFLYNKLLEDFMLQTDLATSPLTKETFEIDADYEVHKKVSVDYLEDSKLYPTDLIGGNLEVTLLKLNSANQYTPARSPDDALFIRIDHFFTLEGVTPVIPVTATESQKQTLEERRQSFDVVYPTPFRSKTYTIFAGEEVPLESSLVHWILSDQVEKYRLIPITEAFQQVQDTDTYLRYLVLQDSTPYAEYEELNVERFDIQSVDIAYYMRGEFQEYLQPVYRFTGTAKIVDSQTRADFVIYIPAIDYN